MSAWIDAITALAIGAVLLALTLRIALNTTATALSERLDEAGTWDELLGRDLGSIAIGTDRIDVRCGGRLVKWIPAVQDGLISVLADRDCLVIVNRKTLPRRASVYLRSEPQTWVARPARLGGEVLLETGRGAKLTGYDVPMLVERLLELGWPINRVAR